MRLDSARSLKQHILEDLLAPFARQASRLGKDGAAAVAAATSAGDLSEHPVEFGVGARPFEMLPQIQRSIAIGLTGGGREYRIALRVQRPGLVNSPLMERLRHEARGEVDVRLVGRIDKRTTRPRRATRTRPRPAAPLQIAVPWYHANTRPLLIGASAGHFDVTAGTIGGFADRGGVTCLLSNNHVLANEDEATLGDGVLQRAAFDGGRLETELVARLSFWIRLKPSRPNLVDAALATLEPGIGHDASRLRELDGSRDGRLTGLGPAVSDAGVAVRKIGRTTGQTKGRVTAFAIDNLIVNYDAGNLRFDDQIEIEGAGQQAFSDGGDSGSLIVNAGTEAVALLFAGADSGGRNGLGLTYANPIHRVLTDLKARLLF